MPFMKSLVVEIERILPGGKGLAHAEGLTVLVPLTAPGDTVLIELERVKGRLGFGKLKEVIKRSSVRVDPPCPYFGRCGGCDFQQLNYEAQLEAKVEIIRDCLRRIAHLLEVPAISIQRSPEWGYRSRAAWQFDAQNFSLGYFEGGSHRVCDIEYCAVLEPRLGEAFGNLRRRAREAGLGDKPFQIDAVAGDDGVSIVPALGQYESTEVSIANSLGTYQFNAESFFQINRSMLQPLVATALAPLASTSNSLALDLYCGVGLFTLPLARAFSRVIGIESNATALRFAKRNLQQAALHNAVFVTSRVGEWLLDNQPSEFGELDFLLLDPPRTGAEPSAIQGILKHRPKRICYVSCDPATLARDLKLLLAEYELQSIAALDLFPQTHHVETVVQLVIKDR
jgi:23S rRNA (uracil1939-C5)-methyltransferase